MEYFWYFVLYSALGFLLEVGYAWCTGGRRDRKRTLVLPLCPVYGLGALVVLALPEEILTHPLLLMVLGGTAATGVEYITAVSMKKCWVSPFGITGSCAGICTDGCVYPSRWPGPPCCQRRFTGCIRLSQAGWRPFRSL